MKRFLSFDIARAICIILVVLGHYFPDGSPGWYAGVRTVIYYFHMPLFFFVSGFVFAADNSGELSYKKFIFKKFRRLMIPYLSTSVLIICLKLVSQNFTTVDNPVTFSSFYRMLYLPEAGYFLWFIWALWWMFVVSPICRTKESRLVLFVVSIILHFIPDILENNICCINEFQNMFMYFNLGAVCTYYSESIIKKLSFVVSVAVFSVSVALFYFFDISDSFRFVPAVAGIAVVMAISLYFERKKSNGAVRALLKIYASSYIIYLFHTTFNGFARMALSRFPVLVNGSDYLGFTAGAIVIVACGVIGPMLLHKYVLSKTRITRFCFGLM